MYERLLIAYDGSEGARKALEVGLGMARDDRAAVTVLAIEAHLPHYGATVGEVNEELEREESESKALLEEARALAATHDVPIETEIRAGHAAQTIVAVAKENDADLIVIGHSGHSGVWGSLLGTTAERVSRHSDRSVLIVR
ncbi:MAG: universal stress protein [Actinomycetota bacterium]